MLEAYTVCDDSFVTYGPILFVRSSSKPTGLNSRRGRSTSANRSGRPIQRTVDDATARILQAVNSVPHD